MATNYVKVRPAVARKLGVIDFRAEYPDGNIQLYEKDLSLIDRGWVFGRRDATVARIGGYLMDPYRNREEHDRAPEDCVALPEPTDEAWRLPEENADETEAADDDAAEAADGNREGGSQGSLADSLGGSQGSLDGSLALAEGEEGGEG